ncbi:hypothetical protein Agub_g5827, partial [Astrephomene gubernaculifera]
LFSSAIELAEAVLRAVSDCPHTDEWEALLSTLEAALGALQHTDAAHAAAAAAGADAANASSAAALRRLQGVVHAGQLLAARGLPLTVRHISSCGAEEAARCVRQVLGRVIRSAPSMSTADWSQLWTDLTALRTAAFATPPIGAASWPETTAQTATTTGSNSSPHASPSATAAAATTASQQQQQQPSREGEREQQVLPARLLLSEMCRCLLHCGRTDLAAKYLREGAPDGEGGVVFLEPEAADALIASVAAEILAGANDPWDAAAQQAAACLALASPDSPPATALARLMRALQLLPELGFDEQQLMPVQVMQMKDRFDVVRIVLQQYEDNDAGTGPAASARGRYGMARGSSTAISFAKAAAAALGGGRNSRRRAAVRAAGQAAAAGGRAAAALAGGLLAVAGRVAPNMTGAVADRVVPVAGLLAGAVTSAAGVPLLYGRNADAASAGGGGGGGDGSGSPSQQPQPPYKQLGRLLEVAELLGLDRPEDELRIKDLAARAALRAGDLGAAQHLALGLVGAGYTPAWSLCADLGSCKRLSDDAVRQKLLSYALLYCPS